MSHEFVQKLAGAKVLIHPKVCDLKDLRDAFNNAGYGNIEIAEESDYQALCLAVKSYGNAQLKHLTGSRILVESLKRKTANGVECVLVKKGEDHNDYQQQFTAHLEEVDGKLHVKTSTSSVSEGELTEEFRKAKATAPLGNVRNAVASILERLDGIKVISSLYWIPDEQIASWENALGYLSSAHGATVDAVQAWTMKHDLSDPDTIDCVCDALKAFVEKEQQQLQKELAENDMEDQALARRRLRAADVRRKIAQYEKALDTSMQALHDAMIDVDSALSAASSIQDEQGALGAALEDALA